jgi:hypothetical protein
LYEGKDFSSPLMKSIAKILGKGREHENGSQEGVVFVRLHIARQAMRPQGLTLFSYSLDTLGSVTKH